MSPNPSELAQQLRRENAAWAALVATLADEERALIDGDADRLAALGAAKYERLHAASDLARARLDRLRNAGHTPDAAGMDAWLATQADPAVQMEWTSLRVLENEARASNLRVGKLIEMRLAATRQSLNVLMHAATGKNSLYDPTGQAIASRPSKPLTAC